MTPRISGRVHNACRHGQLHYHVVAGVLPRCYRSLFGHACLVFIRPSYAIRPKQPLSMVASQIGTHSRVRSVAALPGPVRSLFHGLFAGNLAQTWPHRLPAVTPPESLRWRDPNRFPALCQGYLGGRHGRLHGPAPPFRPIEALARPRLLAPGPRPGSAPRLLDRARPGPLALALAPALAPAPAPALVPALAPAPALALALALALAPEPA